VHEPELAAEVEASQQAVFDLGHLVILEAEKYYPNGVLIDVPRWDMEKAFTSKQYPEYLMALYLRRSRMTPIEASAEVFPFLDCTNFLLTSPTTHV
jgi:hypothetical protein